MFPVPMKSSGIGVRVSVTFHLTCVHIILVRFGLLSGHLWEMAAHSVDHMFLFVFCLLVILVFSRFGFEDWIDSVPGICILFTFLHKVLLW